MPKLYLSYESPEAESILQSLSKAGLITIESASEETDPKASFNPKAHTPITDRISAVGGYMSDEEIEKALLERIL